MFAIAEYNSMRQSTEDDYLTYRVEGAGEQVPYLIVICIITLANCQAYFSHCPDANDAFQGKIRLVDS